MDIVCKKKKKGYRKFFFGAEAKNRFVIATFDFAFILQKQWSKFEISYVNTNYVEWRVLIEQLGIVIIHEDGTVIANAINNVTKCVYCNE